MRRIPYLLTALLLVLCLTSYGQASRFYFRHFMTDDGLSHNTVLSILQDKKGFIWLGTKDGLNRFDGFNFKKFRNDRHQFGGVGDDQLHAMCQDSEGKLWIGTGRGLYRFDPETESFEESVIAPFDRVTAIVTDGRQSIWFLAANQLWSYHLKTKKLINLHIPANCLIVGQQQHLVMGNDEGEIISYRPGSGKSKHFQAVDKSLPINLKPVTAIAETSTGYVIGTNKLGLLSFDLKTRKASPVLSKNADGTELNVRAILPGEPGEFWVATESGVVVYKANTKETMVFQKNQSDPYAINDNAIYTFCKDSDGGMWVGTYFGGLNYQNAKNSRFRKYYPLKNEQSISGNAISAICEDRQQRIWIGTEDAGISKLDISSGVVRNFRFNGKSNGLAHNNVHALLMSGNELYIGLFQNGMEVLDINTGFITERYGTLAAKYKERSNFVLCLLATRQGKIYLGTIGPSAGLYEFNKTTKQVTAVEGFDLSEGVFALSEDHLGRLWIGTANKGAICYDPISRKTTHVKFGNGSLPKTGGAETTIHYIYEDSLHNLWFCTEGAGVFKLDSNGNKKTTYNIQTGLSSNYVYRIVEDEQHQLWMSSTKGLMRMNTVSGKITTYTQDNGLITDQFNYSASYRASNGIIYFGSVKGLIGFDPQDFNKTLKSPPLYLTTLEINNLPVLPGSRQSVLRHGISYTDSLQLTHSQNNINLEFAALDFSSAKAIRYRYRLKGLNDSWITLEENRKVFFTGLAPGRYIFEFAAESNTGEWKTSPKQLFIHIQPPLYLSMTAYFLYLLLTLMVIYYSIRSYEFYLNRQHQNKLQQFEHEKKQEIYQSKIDFFTNIAHELRTPLTLIKLPLDQLTNVDTLDTKVKENLTMINKNTNRLIELTNQLLDFRKSDRENLRLVFVKTNINTLLSDIYEDFQIIAQEQKLSYELELPRHLTLHAYVDIEAFKKILINLISNAFKYAERNIRISISPLNSNDDLFSLEVQNDGALIPARYHEKIFEPFFRIDDHDKHSGSGIGLALARSLTEMHNGTLKLTTNDKYNIFKLSLPIHQQEEVDFKVEETVDAGIEINDTEDRTSAEGLPSILLVEDHNDILKYISQELRGEYFILKANDGVEAMELLEKHPVQLVVSDIMMPRMNGLDLCRRIKTDLTYSHIPVILLTAKTSVDSRIEGLGTGADAYIDKPFSMSHLEMQIKSLLRNRKLVKEHFARSPLSQIQAVAYSKTDVSFLEQLTTVISERLSDSSLDVEMLSRTMNMSRPTLYRKIKALTNMPPSALISLYRLKHAAELLATRQYKINEISFIIGYNSPANFTRDFQKQFGIKPSAYVKQLDQ